MADILKLLEPSDAVGIIPTDTTYGIVAKAKNPRAVARVYALKHRNNKPGTIIAADIDQLVDLGLKRSYLKAVEVFWPGPVSIIIPCGDQLSYLHLGLNSLAVRIPSDANILKILTHTGPLLTTSANLPSRPIPSNIKEAKKYFDNKVDFYVDGGEIKNKASTIIRVIDDEVEVIRQGDVLPT